MFKQTLNTAQEMNFPEAKFSLLDIDFPVSEEYMKSKNKKIGDIDQLMADKKAKMEEAKLTKQFLKEIQLNEKDLQIKPTIADKKRAFEKEQDTWVFDQVKPIEDKSTTFAKNN